MTSYKLKSIKGIITDSCDGKVTANVLFGKAGVGKSTISSWMSSIPGLFDVGTGKVEFLESSFFSKKALTNSSKPAPVQRH